MCSMLALEIGSVPLFKSTSMQIWSGLQTVGCTSRYKHAWQHATEGYFVQYTAILHGSEQSWGCYVLLSPELEPSAHVQLGCMGCGRRVDCTSAPTSCQLACICGSWQVLADQSAQAILQRLMRSKCICI